MSALLLVANATAPSTTWGERGKSAVILTIIVTLILAVAKWAANRDIELSCEEDEIIEESEYAPQHPANRLTFNSSQAS